MEPTNGIRPWQWIVTIIIIIVLIVLGIMMFRGKGAQDTTTDTTTTGTTDDGLASGQINRVVVSDQFPGNVVYVSSAQLNSAGWVVVHKDEAGKPGKIIGSVYFEKGIAPGKVTLSENTVEGGIYYAMLHSDDGDKVFNVAKDLPLKDAAGNTIMKLFRVSQTVTEFKG